MTEIKKEVAPASMDDSNLAFVNMDEIDVGVNEQPVGVVGNEVEIYSEQHNPVSLFRVSASIFV